MIQFDRPDGQKAPGYLSRAATHCGGSVVVIQEWWGLNAQIKKVADRIAHCGFHALVPDLYRGKVAGAADEANHLMSHLDWSGAVSQDIAGAVAHLEAGAEKVAVLGFCMGGALAILAACKVPGLDAAVCFYGIPPAEACDTSTIRVPMQFHFANDDDWCTPKAVDELEKRLKAANVPHELHRYPAKHAFMNEERPEVYNAHEAHVAWDRAIQFLASHLRTG